VYHIGQFITQNKYFNIGDSVVVNIDGEKRKMNARLHSGGHLLDVAVMNLGLKDLKPGKVKKKKKNKLVENYVFIIFFFLFSKN